MPERRRRVALVCGGIPQDSNHLTIVGAHVDLTVHRSSWLPAGVAVSAGVPLNVRVRDHAPVRQTHRGHLGFVYRGLWRDLDRELPDVVHVISEPWGLLAAQAAGWVRRHPASKLVLHGCDTLWHHGGAIERAGRRLLLRSTLPVTAGWVAENDKALTVASASGLPPDSVTARIHTTPRDALLFRLPDEEERRAARAALCLEGEVAVGLIARLVPEKGVRPYLEAAQHLVDAGWPGKFFVAGDGPLLEEVHRAPSQHVVPLGRLAHPSGVLHLLRALDVLACPSLTTPEWEDQGPRAVLEALMCGIVPVATDTGALREMLDGRGVITASTGSRDLADAIVAAGDRARDEQVRRAIAGWAYDRWSAPAVAAQLLAVWDEVCARPVLTTTGGSAT